MKQISKKEFDLLEDTNEELGCFDSLKEFKTWMKDNYVLAGDIFTIEYKSGDKFYMLEDKDIAKKMKAIEMEKVKLEKEKFKVVDLKPEEEPEEEKMNIFVKFGKENYDKNYYEFDDVKDLDIITIKNKEYLSFSYAGRKLGVRSVANFPQERTWFGIKGKNAPKVKHEEMAKKGDK